MTDDQPLADRFEEHRPRLRALARRMLGSSAEADDVVQETWLRLTRADAGEIANLGGWLTTAAARVCLSMLRSRSFLAGEPPQTAAPDPPPEEEAVLSDSVGLALQVVLDRLNPEERLAFVLHDMFGVPFDEIGPLVGRTPAAARKLASRARQRVKNSEMPAERDPAHEREAVSAFFAAARDGDFAALVRVLDPGVVLRIDADSPASPAYLVVNGASDVARQALSGLAPALRAVELSPVLVAGKTGVVASRNGRPITVISFSVTGGRIAEIDATTVPERVRELLAGISYEGITDER